MRGNICLPYDVQNLIHEFIYDTHVINHRRQWKLVCAEVRNEQSDIILLFALFLCFHYS